MKQAVFFFAILGVIIGFAPDAICRPVMQKGRVLLGEMVPYKVSDTVYPNYEESVHNINRIGMTISNWGMFGNPNASVDGKPSCEYPINSGFEYLSQGGIWIGGIGGEDTTVSTTSGIGALTNEFSPDFGSVGAIIRRSSLRHSADYDPAAISEQDIICTYTDTFTDPILTDIDSYDNRPHIPLRVAVIQSSHVWSFSNTEDFILMDYRIVNLDTLPIKDMSIGIMINASIHHDTTPPLEWFGGLRGFRPAVKALSGSCREADSITIAWAADNDGNPGSDGQ